MFLCCSDENDDNEDISTFEEPESEGDCQDERPILRRQKNVHRKKWTKVEEDEIKKYFSRVFKVRNYSKGPSMQQSKREEPINFRGDSVFFASE